MPQSIACCSSGSPGSETCDHCARCSRAASFALSSPSGSCSAASSSERASPTPWSEPAAATHSVRLAPAGTVTAYCSSPPVPLPNGPSSQSLGADVPSLAEHELSPCVPRKAPPVSAAVPEAGSWLAATSAA